MGIVRVTQEWMEDDDSKTGWCGVGWVLESTGDHVCMALEVIVSDEDKYSHPTHGILVTGELTTEEYLEAMDAVKDNSVNIYGTVVPMADHDASVEVTRVLACNELYA